MNLQSKPTLERFIIILAGGTGERFWPCSQPSNPKQCLRIAGEKSLLEQTIDRALDISSVENIVVVTGLKMEAAVKAQCEKLPHKNILVEPSSRNTSPCVAWVAKEIMARGGGILIFWPSDHVIYDQAQWVRVHETAIKQAEANQLVIIGINPTYPATGYGYIEVSQKQEMSSVISFTEKPDYDKAFSFLKSGRFLWNAGVFIATAQRLLNDIHKYQPRTFEAISRWPQVELSAVWNDTEAVSFDHGVLERTENILVVPFWGGWSDLGTWDMMSQTFPKRQSHRVIADDFHAVDSMNCSVYAQKMQVALVGVKDLIVIQHADSLLVVHQNAVQQVREVPNLMKRKYTHEK